MDEESFNRIRTKYSNMPFYKVETGYKIPAAWLISKCGWKGKRLGNAGCYEKQPLILINCGGATGGEIATLMKKIQNDVNDEFNIDLFPEVCIVV